MYWQQRKKSRMRGWKNAGKLCKGSLENSIRLNCWGMWRKSIWENSWKKYVNASWTSKRWKNMKSKWTKKIELKLSKKITFLRQIRVMNKEFCRLVRYSWAKYNNFWKLWQSTDSRDSKQFSKIGLWKVQLSFCSNTKSTKKSQNKYFFISNPISLILQIFQSRNFTLSCFN